jgi:aryl-alcohol dehydrogenase-like predicted oxidoreductase
MYPVPPARETQGLTDKYISTWLKDQKREDIVLATKVGSEQHSSTRTLSSSRR